YISEALELCGDWYSDFSTCGQFDVEDESRRPQLNGRALAHQHPDRRVAFVAYRDLLRLNHQRAWFSFLVLPRQVHPEQPAAELGIAESLPNLVRSEGLGMPCTSARPEFQESALAQFCPLHRSAGSGAMPRAG